MNRYSTFLFLFVFTTCTVTEQASAVDDSLKTMHIESGTAKARELYDQKKAELAKLESELDEISDRSRIVRRGQPAAPGYFASTREQRAAVQSLASRIKALKEEIWQMPPWVQPDLHLDSLQLGATGILRYPRNATSKEPAEEATRSSRSPRPVVGGFDSTRQAMAGIQAMQEQRRQEILSKRAAVAAMPVEVEVIQVLSQDELVGTAYGITFIMTGIDTSGIVDEAIIVADNPFAIERTRSYENAIGTTTTVFELRQLNDEVMQLLNASVPRIHPDRLRTWSDRTGSFTVEAELVSRQGHEIVLRKSDGERIAVPASRLSKEDLEYVDTHLGK